MSDLLWPGDHRAGNLCSDARLLDAMVEVEVAWSAALAAAGIAPGEAVVGAEQSRRLLRPGDVEALAVTAERSGTPVLPLVRLLRSRLGEDEPTAHWLHRGLTSQDVVDTALMICAREVVAAVRADLVRQTGLLAALAERHRDTRMVARTLTQQAVPMTFGLKAAHWLTGILDAADDLAGVTLNAQFGGAAGTMAAVVELAGSEASALGVAQEAAARLGLSPAAPWHTVRTTVTRLGDALVRCTDTWGHVANDVLVLSRPEIGELSEGAGGGSSTMPHKSNPVFSALVRRAALAAPALGATLHTAAAETIDERTPGGWHLEWPTLRTLLRRTVVAGSQTSDLLRDLVVHEARMAATLDASPGARSEQVGMAELTGRPPAPEYLGAIDRLLGVPLARAAELLTEEWS